ncbi:MAG: hypothetical protein Q8873_00350 [Bacillota bacterium]|nr:hypothetical protein [Bacillota bacterium]
MEDRLTKRLKNGVVQRADIKGDSVILRLAAYEDLGTTSDFAELVKARDDGRIAKCTCGECFYRSSSEYEEEYNEPGETFCTLHDQDRDLNDCCMNGEPKGERRLPNEP